MKIPHIITGLQKAAGTSVFVGELASQQSADGHDVSILVRSRTNPEQHISPSVRICTNDSWSAKLEFEKGDVHSPTPARSSNYDIIHLHALWDTWLTQMSRHFRKQGAKIVWSPHGMLTPWALKNKWPKKLAYNLPSKLSSFTFPCAARAEGCFVSRIQRKKGLSNLLSAWAKLSPELKAGWNIKIAGPDEDDRAAELKSLAADLKIADSIEFLGPVYDEAKDKPHAEAAFSVLPRQLRMPMRNFFTKLSDWCWSRLDHFFDFGPCGHGKIRHVRNVQHCAILAKGVLSPFLHLYTAYKT